MIARWCSAPRVTTGSMLNVKVWQVSDNVMARWILFILLSLYLILSISYNFNMPFTFIMLSFKQIPKLKLQIPFSIHLYCIIRQLNIFFFVPVIWKQSFVFHRESINLKNDFFPSTVLVFIKLHFASLLQDKYTGTSPPVLHFFMLYVIAIQTVGSLSQPRMSSPCRLFI